MGNQQISMFSLTHYPGFFINVPLFSRTRFPHFPLSAAMVYKSYSLIYGASVSLEKILIAYLHCGEISVEGYRIRTEEAVGKTNSVRLSETEARKVLADWSATCELTAFVPPLRKVPVPNGIRIWCDYSHKTLDAGIMVGVECANFYGLLQGETVTNLERHTITGSKAYHSFVDRISPQRLQTCLIDAFSYLASEKCEDPHSFMLPDLIKIIIEFDLSLIDQLFWQILVSPDMVSTVGLHCTRDDLSDDRSALFLPSSSAFLFHSYPFASKKTHAKVKKKDKARRKRYF